MARRYPDGPGHPEIPDRGAAKIGVLAISWAAVSSKPQVEEKESLSDQHRLNHQAAEERGWQIFCDLTIPGESRYYESLAEAQAQISAYRELAELAATGQIKWLICKDRSRLGRSYNLNQEIAHFLRQRGIRVYSRAFPPTSIEKRAVGDVWGQAIESGLSEAQILHLVGEREMGMQARARAGKLPNKPPWGFVYSTTEGRPVPVFQDPVAEVTVKFVISQYHRGISKRRIMLQAHARGYRTPRGKRWSFSALNSIIFQPAYYALASFGRRRTVIENGRCVRKVLPFDEWTVAPGKWEAPFTAGDWQKTLEEHRRRTEEHPRSRSTRYPLSRIAWCLDCDLPLMGSPAGGKRYYRCSSYERYRNPIQKIKSAGHYIQARELHRQLGQYFQCLVSDPAVFQSMLAQAQSESQEDLEAERRALLLQEKELLHRKLRWQDAYEQGAIDLPLFAGRIKLLEEQEDSLKARQEEIEERLNRQEVRKGFEQRLQRAVAEAASVLGSELSAEECERFRAIFTRILKRVYVRDRKISQVVFREPP